MDAQELYQRFVAFSEAASNDLQAGLSCADHSLSDAVFNLDENGFQKFWDRITRDDELHRRWLDRLCRGYTQEKEHWKAAFDAASNGTAKPHGPGTTFEEPRDPYPTGLPTRVHSLSLRFLALPS